MYTSFWSYHTTFLRTCQADRKTVVSRQSDIQKNQVRGKWSGLFHNFGKICDSGSFIAVCGQQMWQLAEYRGTHCWSSGMSSVILFSNASICTPLSGHISIFDFIKISCFAGWWAFENILVKMGTDVKKGTRKKFFTDWLTVLRSAHRSARFVIRLLFL